MPPLTGDPTSYPLSDFEEGMTGTCLCGAVTITINQKDLFTKPNGHVCHCANCRKSSGSMASNVFMLPSKSVTVSDPKGYWKNYMDSATGSGRTIPRGFCSNCGSVLGAVPDENTRAEWAEYAFVSVGLFPRMPVPEYELFTKHRHDWVKPIEGAKEYDYLPGVNPE